jgi:hypothetical protein
MFDRKRWCPRGVHLGTGVHMWRLVLARLTLDRDEEAIVTAQVGDCEGCWREIAVGLAADYAMSIVTRWGVPDMTASGLVTGPAVDHVLLALAGAVDAAAADERDLRDAA